MRVLAVIHIIGGVILLAIQVWEATIESGGRPLFWILGTMFLIVGTAQWWRFSRQT